jgi:RecA-family ATPase
MIITDAYDLLQTQPKSINYLVEGLLPLGSCGDLFGAPGEGKSSLTLDLMKAIASGVGQWHGLRCASGTVVILGGERTNIDAFQRDLHRSGKHKIDKRALLLPQAESGQSAIWEWNKEYQQWYMTKWGKEISDWLMLTQPVMVVLDTTMSVARGSDQLNNSQQYDLGDVIRRWTQTLNTTAISISHTNQASFRDQVDWRLGHGWSMRRDSKSPNYTTEWSELPVVR